MSRTRVRLAWGLAAVLAVLTVVAIGPRGSGGLPLDPRSTGPAGVRGLVDVLEEIGVAVSVGSGVPEEADTSALVIVDGTSEVQQKELRSWVADGGVLVVADPLSDLAPGLTGLASIAFTEPTIEPACDDPAAVDVERVSVADAFVFDLPPDSTGCFPRNDGFWMVRQSVGSGSIVSLGGPFTLTNDLLDDADNAVLLVNLLTTEDDPRVRVVEGEDPDGGDGGLADVLPDQVGLALAQIPIVWLALIWWRARRLGRPVGETPPVPLDAAETTVAVGNLMQRAGRAQEAAAVIRADVATHVLGRLGLPDGLDGPTVVAVAADQTGLSADLLTRVLLNPLPTDDDGLTRFANSAAHLKQDFIQHRGSQAR